MMDKLAVALVSFFFFLTVKHLTPPPYNSLPLKKKNEMLKENKIQTGFSRFGEAEAQVDQNKITPGKEFYEDASLEAQQKRQAF